MANDPNIALNRNIFDENRCYKWLLRQREQLKSIPIECPNCSHFVTLTDVCESCNHPFFVTHRSKSSKKIGIGLSIFLLVSSLFGGVVVFYGLVKILGNMELAPVIIIFVLLTYIRMIWAMLINFMAGIHEEIKSGLELPRTDKLLSSGYLFLKKGLVSQAARCYAELISLQKEGEFFLGEHFLSTLKKLLYAEIKPSDLDIMFKNLFIYESWLQLRRESMAYQGVSHKLVWGMPNKIYKIISDIISDNKELLVLSEEFRLLRRESKKTSNVLDRLIEVARTRAPEVARRLAIYPID